MSRQVSISLPNLGVGERPVRLVQWLVESGAEVIEGERIAEVLADGVLFHVAAPATGVLEECTITAGSIVERDTTLGRLRLE